MPLIAQLLQIFVPLVLQSVADYKQRHGGAEPTSQQLFDHINANADLYLAEGAAWTAAHPKQDG